MRVTRDALSTETTLAWVDGTWHRGHPSGTFPLRQAVNRPGAPSPWLTRQWNAVQTGLTRLGLRSVDGFGVAQSSVESAAATVGAVTPWAI